MPTPNPQPKPGQSAHNIAVAHVSLRLAAKLLVRLADLPAISESDLDELRTHMGRANAHCAKLANGFDAARNNESGNETGKK